MNIDYSRVNCNLGRIIKQRRITIPLTLSQLAASSGVSTSHLGRIEKGERFPSARVLNRITRPLGFSEGELFALAGYLSPPGLTSSEAVTGGDDGQLDPVIAAMLRREPAEVQRAVIVVLTMLKSIAVTFREIGKNG